MCTLSDCYRQLSSAALHVRAAEDPQVSFLTSREPYPLVTAAMWTCAEARTSCGAPAINGARPCTRRASRASRNACASSSWVLHKGTPIQKHCEQRCKCVYSIIAWCLVIWYTPMYFYNHSGHILCAPLRHCDMQHTIPHRTQPTQPSIMKLSQIRIM